ncbi:uncharacterized protein TNCV_2337171 [Trichonephila clavipes]|nr:uncharacterized protein TNCV_2337171 [Trichonephila clavipes]
MIACFVEENHDNWDRFLHEFSFALRTAINETTGKTPAELCLGRKIITPFRKLVLVTDGAEYVGGNVEKLFDEARQRQHKTWKKYYNRKRRAVNIKVNDLVLESSNWSNRSNSEKSRRSRKPSGNENKSCKSNKGNAGLEDLKVRRDRAVESTGTSERYDGKRPKICRKRSFRGSDYEQHRKRKVPVLPPREPEILPGTSNQGQASRSNPPKQKSSRKTRMEFDRTQETRPNTNRGHSTAEGRPVRPRKKPTVVADPDHCIVGSETSVKQDNVNQSSTLRATNQKMPLRHELPYATVPGTSFPNPDWLLLNVGGRHFATTSSLTTRRVGQRCTLNLLRAETSSRWCGVVVRRGVPDQVSSTSLDHGSKLRDPSPKALV